MRGESLTAVTKRCLYARRSKRLLLLAPSGLYQKEPERDTRTTQPHKDCPSGVEDNEPEPMQPREVVERALTKNEKQAVCWLELVGKMVPWYLETFRVTKSLSQLEVVQEMPGQCATCERERKGLKVLCLMFTRTSMQPNASTKPLL